MTNFSRLSKTNKQGAINVHKGPYGMLPEANKSNEPQLGYDGHKFINDRHKCHLLWT